MGLIKDRRAGIPLTESVQQLLDQHERFYREGRITKDQFHHETSHTYWVIGNAAMCRYHAEQVSADADPVDKSKALQGLANACVLEDKMEEAFDLYAQALQLDKEENMVYEAGRVFLESDKFQEALTCFETLITKDEFDVPENYYYAGQAAAGLENYELAIRYFKQVLECDPADAEIADAEYCLGLCYQNTNDFYRAMHHYKRCLDVDPLFAEALGNIGSMYYNEEGDIKTSIEYLKKAEALALEQKNTSLLFTVYRNLSALYKKTMNEEQHAYYYQKLMEMAGFGFLFETAAGDDEADEA